MLRRLSSLSELTAGSVVSPATGWPQLSSPAVTPHQGWIVSLMVSQDILDVWMSAMTETFKSCFPQLYTITYYLFKPLF